MVFTITEVAIIAQNQFIKFELSLRYGVKDMDGSAKRIQKAALGTPEDHFLILLAHNGPTGATRHLKFNIFSGGDGLSRQIQKVIF